MRANLDLFACPSCRSDLAIDGGKIACTQCPAVFVTDGNIPLMYIPNNWSGREDVTEKVKAFYEETPFPNYELLETSADLVQKANKSYFANILNQQIPFGARVIEIGCGTGQMANYLGIVNRNVFGTDLCLNSLKLAESFRNRNDLKHVGFYQMNLFRPIFKEEQFHLVISNGVLHHTSDPLGGFKAISKLVKKGGYIAIGLYNTYGRLVTDARRILFDLTRDRFKSLDARLKDGTVSEERRMTWFKDQYKNPHESKHTIGEVLKWFEQTGFKFVYGIPNPVAFEHFNQEDRIFQDHERGSALDHFIVQLKMIFTGGREGGFFIMIGRREKIV